MEKTINTKEINRKKLEFESMQNAIGFFDLLLRIAKRNPKLWKEICEEKKEKSVPPYKKSLKVL